jgi:hypothetical protein
VPVRRFRHADWPLLAVVSVAAPFTAAAFVLIGFVANDVPIIWLWRPLVISVVASLLIELAFWWLLGGIRGAVWGFVTVATLTGMFVLAGLTILALFIFGLIRSRPLREYQLVGLLATLFSVVLLGVPAAIGVEGRAFDWTPLGARSVDLGTASSGPSIHILLLDGYPREDVLADAGFDNQQFLRALEDRGFDVYDDSLSNYDLTPFSLLSILSLEHIESIEAIQTARVQGSVAEQQRFVTRALLDPPIFDSLERIGYRTRLQTGDVVLVSMDGADTVWNAGTATNFELDALQRTPLAGALEAFGFAAAQHREHIESSLAEFANTPDGRVFTFAHVLTPHAPFVYEADGGPATSPPCYPATCQLYHPVADGVGWSRVEYRTRMAAHIQHVNQLVLRSIDGLLAQDPNSVVIVLSDHGTSGEDPLDRFRNLILARTPDYPHLLGNAPTPINVLPRVLNAYLGTQLPLLPDTLYRHGDGGAWLEMEQVAGESELGHGQDRRYTTSLSSR